MSIRLISILPSIGWGGGPCEAWWRGLSGRNTPPPAYGWSPSPRNLGEELSRPSCQRRQTHQDRVDIAAGLEAEQGAAVVEQVELGIAAAPFELPGAVRLVMRRRHPPPHQLRKDV